MSPAQRISFLLVVASMVICLFVVFFWSAKPDYVVLFSNLSMKDAGEIQSKLMELKVPSKVEGTTIKVPAKTVYETRLVLANEGLPRASEVGYEIFDKIKVGQTDYMQRLSYQRALEGELARTINSLTQIEYSRVHLVLPEETIFKDKEEPASASIVLTLHPGAELDKRSVMAITNLVAASVEGLQSSNITIIDSRGSLLTSPADENMASGLSARQIEIQRNAEKYLETKAASLLEGVLGPNKSIVRVSVAMDFSQKEKTEESFKPDQQVARSENRVEEASGGGETENSVEKTVTNYEIGRTVEHMIDATGQLQRVSVAVVVDGIYKIASDGEHQGKKVYSEREATELESLKKIVINAIGLDFTRGDQIEVTNIAFDNTYLEQRIEEEQATRKMGNFKQIVAQWPWLLVLVMFGIIINIYRSALKSAAETKVSLPKFFSKQAPAQFRSVIGEDGEEIKRDDLYGQGLELPPASKLEDEVSSLARKNPDTIARIVKTWMKE
jgi:flagellar M-ring protein FliF